MGFEPTIPASDRKKTVHALDRAASVISAAISNTNMNVGRRSLVAVKPSSLDFCILPRDEVLYRGFGLVIGLIEQLQIITTSNHNTIANSHTPHFTTAHTKSSQSAVSSPHCWANSSSSRSSSAPGFTFSQPGAYLVTKLGVATQQLTKM
jgi:hypothetical protein